MLSSQTSQDILTMRRCWRTCRREADPCGERGEFHTFVWDGPGFARPVAYQTGERVSARPTPLLVLRTS